MILKGLAAYRQDSDYDIFAEITLEIARQQYENAVEFVRTVGDYLRSQIGEPSSADKTE